MNRLLQCCRVGSKIIIKSFKHYKDASGSFLSPGLAYMTLLTMVPYMLVGLMVFQWLGGIEVLVDQALPKDVTLWKGQWFVENRSLWQDYILEVMGNTVDKGVISDLKIFLYNLNFDAIGYTGLVFLLIASTQLVTSIDRAIQRVWETKRRSNYLYRYALYVCIVVFAPVAATITYQIIRLNLLSHLQDLFPFAEAAFIVGILFFTFGFSPRVKHLKSLSLASAIVTALLLWGLKEGFIYLISTFMSFDRIYGSLAFLPILLIFTRAFWSVLIYGLCLNVTLEKYKVSH